jgi:hypothetical protein
MRPDEPESVPELIGPHTAAAGLVTAEGFLDVRQRASRDGAPARA